MTDALVRDIYPQWGQILSGLLHLLVKETFISKTDQTLSLTTIHGNAGSWSVYISSYVHLLVIMVKRYQLVECVCLQLKLLDLLAWYTAS